MQSTEWRPVVGYEGLYEVSDDGQVRRSGEGPGARVGRILKAAEFLGYRLVALSRNGRVQRVRVHRLVAFAFIGPPGVGEEIRHLDGNSAHNAVANLRWGTPVQNMEDQIAHGRHANTEKTECVQGHAFDLVNTHIGTDGKRKCRQCDRNRGRASRLRTSMGANHG